MYPIIGTLHLTIGTEWPKEKYHVIIVVENTSLPIARILMTRTKLKRPRRSAQLVELVVDAAMSVVADAKVTTRSGATIKRMGIEMITKMLLKIGSMLGCAIAVVRSVDGMTLIFLDFMPLGGMILEPFPCLMNIIIGNCHRKLLVLQLKLEPLKEAE